MYLAPEQFTVCHCLAVLTGIVLGFMLACMLFVPIIQRILKREISMNTLFQQFLAQFEAALLGGLLKTAEQEIHKVNTVVNGVIQKAVDHHIQNLSNPNTLSSADNPS